MRLAWLVLPLLLALTACGHKDTPMAQQPDLKAVQAKLAFSCVHEADRLPTLDPQADQLFQYARWLQRQYQPEQLPEAGRLYRIAAAYGHYKANNNLQRMVGKGELASPDAVNEVLDLAEQLVAANIANGYYLTGHYLQIGYGFDQDNEKALMYFRKAADLGSADAQAYVGDLLLPPELAPVIGRQMLRCATAQGHAKAAVSLGFDLQTDEIYPEAMYAFQQAVKAGDSASALGLQEAFDAEKGKSKDEVNYLNVSPDPERVKRYEAIKLFLRRYDGHNPKVPDIDQIVPLPPAKLPPWDGTFQWQKDWEANAAPAKPDEKLIVRLAKAKNLDPATGLAKDPPSQPATPPAIKLSSAAQLPLGSRVASGRPCPQSGLWQCVQPQATPHQVTRLAGQTMPAVLIPNPRSLWQKLKGEPAELAIDSEWELVQLG